MAETIPRNFVLLPKRYLVQESAPGSCIGEIVKKPEVWGAFKSDFTFERSFESEDPEHPEPTMVIYTTVIFDRNNAIEVTINEINYFLVHGENILGFIPPEE